MHPVIQSLVQAALAEDLGDRGDVTSTFFVPETAVSRATILAKADGVLSGMDVAAEVLKQVDPRLKLKRLVKDGSSFAKGDVVGVITGPSRSLLAAERTLLNFIQRLSGVATASRRYRDALGDHKTVLLDTRKTTPGWRLLEKAAVRHGGGSNHRMGLYDAVMVKDNHIAACGSLQSLQHGIDAVKKRWKKIKVQLEAATLDQFEAYLTLRGVDSVLLDNMSLAQLKKAVHMNAGRFYLEASGGITLKTIAKVASTGVDAISVGALTHSAGSIDLSLEFDVDS
ncbi:MAG: carboxylating nicotinate-nucleotide diphosphorylase [Verrucomicrobiaceae bacterium]|nr:carboxylating nicotinate-nucleotide diphosphorylase [Verrucomicrobiaceae bacterium]